MPRLMGGMLLPGWTRGDWKRGCGELTSPGLLGTESKKRLFCFAPAGPRTCGDAGSLKMPGAGGSCGEPMLAPPSICKMRWKPALSSFRPCPASRIGCWGAGVSCKGVGGVSSFLNTDAKRLDFPFTGVGAVLVLPVIPSRGASDDLEPNPPKMGSEKPSSFMAAPCFAGVICAGGGCAAGIGSSVEALFPFIISFHFWKSAWVCAVPTPRSSSCFFIGSSNHSGSFSACSRSHPLFCRLFSRSRQPPCRSPFWRRSSLCPPLSSLCPQRLSCLSPLRRSPSLSRSRSRLPNFARRSFESFGSSVSPCTLG